MTDSQAIQIKQYLKSLDLTVECPIEYAPGAEKEKKFLFTQPGMRYCQAQTSVYSLMQDEAFSRLLPAERDDITERILAEVRGRMLEDMILLETMKALPKQYKVFKLQFASGEYDMVIYDKETNTCAAYEIKHSSQYVREQARHLMNEEKLPEITLTSGLEEIPPEDGGFPPTHIIPRRPHKGCVRKRTSVR